MRNRIGVLVVLALLLSAGVYLLVTARCEPWPVCESEPCILAGGICWGYDVHPCAIGMENTCYQQYFCYPDGPPGDEYWVWDGSTCCYPCDYP